MSDASFPTNSSSTKPIIAIDIDDVLSSSAKAFIEFSNSRWGTTLELNDYDEDWALMWQLDGTNAEHLEIVKTRGDEILTYSVPRMDHTPDAYDVLKQLRNNYTLIVLTSRRTSLKADTLAWINERYAGVFEDDTIYFTGFYDDLTTSSWAKTKGDILRDLNASYLIDDQVKHCNSAAVHNIQALQFGGVGPQVLEPVHESVVRVKDWNGILEFFNAERKRISN